VADDVIHIAAATPEIRVAECEYNAKKILELIKRAKAEKVQLLVLPELCITGATCQDLFLQPTLIKSANDALRKLADKSKDIEVMVVVGLPLDVSGAIINAAAVFYKGQILGFVPKDSAITDILFSLPHNPNVTIGVTIGDTYNNSDILDKATIIANPSASTEMVGNEKKRRNNVKLKSGMHNCVYVQANAGYGESTTDNVYGGHNIIAAWGEILDESPSFGDGWVVSEIDPTAPDKLVVPTSDCLDHQHGPVPHPFISQCEDPEYALNIQAAGLARRIDITKSTAVIGVSGGLDSCLALLITVRAYKLLGKPVSEIVAVTMPGFGTTSHTKANAHRLCEALGIPCREIDITASVIQHLNDINHPEGVYDVVFENAQARMRTMVLMNIANQVNGLVVGTGSLSELALGWATYNGDHMSMYAVNAGVPKTLVRHLVGYIVSIALDLELKKVLESILATKVSPELLPALNDEITQITEDLVGSYELHDFFIYHMLAHMRTPKEIFTLAKNTFSEKYEPEIILHWQKTFYRRFFSQQFKRSCLPDAPQVVSVSLSPRAGFKMPSDASAAIWLRELDEVGL